MADIRWDDAALADLLNSLDGPVGRWLVGKVTEMTALALTKAPLQKRQNWSWGEPSTSYEPRSLGYLKSTVRPHIGYTVAGRLFGSTNAAYGPTLFLEEGGGRYGHAELNPFMSETLYETVRDL